MCTRLCNHCKAHFFFFKLRLTGGKWSNYVHSYISGTHGVNSTPLWAGTKALIPGQCGQPLRNETERSRITYKRLQILLDRITLGFSLSMPFKAFKCYGEWGSRFPGVIEGFLGVEIFDSGIFWVSISFTWGFFAFSKQSEVGILMLLMKQKKFSGVSGVSFFGGVGVDFCPH